ncbi:Uncharacterized protein TCM_004372 [Theobroma cacao]|uniref:Uncharacterized protein n=1 Tax=Theobroma cacao TaxID=3641 RepID=A0A061DPZ1_THECC|nr:Uncharacterized protein TCM_004372 [Theobroma cacao]
MIAISLGKEMPNGVPSTEMPKDVPRAEVPRGISSMKVPRDVPKRNRNKHGTTIPYEEVTVTQNEWQSS